MGAAQSSTARELGYSSADSERVGQRVPREVV